MKIIKFFTSLFRHSCLNNSVICSESFLREGSSGFTIHTGTEYSCTKCNKRWNT